MDKTVTFNHNPHRCTSNPLPFISPVLMVNQPAKKCHRNPPAAVVTEKLFIGSFKGVKSENQHWVTSEDVSTRVCHSQVTLIRNSWSVSRYQS